MSTHYQTAPEDRISYKQKAAYSVGMLVNNLQAAALPAMVVILNIGLGMNALWVGIIGAIPRVFDAISDPLLGYISDNTRTRWGRRRPYIFAGAIISGLIFAIMWQLPSGYLDLISKQPSKEHYQLNGQPIEINSGGGLELSSYSSNFGCVLYADTSHAQQEAGGAWIIDMSDYSAVELNVQGDTIQHAQIKLHGLNQVHTLGLLPEAGEEGASGLYTASLNTHDDITAITHVTLEVSGVTAENEMTIHSFKLRKSESFFIKYFWYFMVMSILFFLAYTVYATPFVAFGYEMTPDYHERTRLHAFANTAGQLAWLGVPWFYALMSSNLFRDQVHGARVLAVGVGLIVAIFGLVPAIFCKESQKLQPKEKSQEGIKANTISFLKGMGVTFKCKPFVQLCGATFLVFNGFQLGMSFSIYVMIYYLFGGNDGDAGKLMGTFGSLTAICTLLVIPLTGWLATRLGKRKTFMCTISLSILGYALKWVGYNPSFPYLLLIACPLVAFGTGSLFTLMGSMISDVCDYDELETHERREGVFGAIYWWMVKVGMALAGLLTGVLLEASGFDVALAAGQSNQTLFLLRVFDVGIPLITSLIALYIMSTYSITEERAHEIREALEARRGKL